MGFSPNGGNISGADDVALSNPANNNVLGYESATQKWKNMSAPSVPNATTSSLGSIQLAGDLGGIATSPTVPGLGAKAALALTKRSFSTSYTLVLADATNSVLHATAATGITVTLPSDSAVAIPEEQAIPWRQYGAGQLTFAAGSGATLVSRGSAFKSAGQYAGGVVTKVAANTWLLEGDITA